MVVADERPEQQQVEEEDGLDDLEFLLEDLEEKIAPMA